MRAAAHGSEAHFLREWERPVTVDPPSPPAADRVRIDKWLWAVRLYHSRSLATAACHAGHVKIAGQTVKPSREVHVGETVTAQQAGGLTRTVRVLALLERRVGAKAVPGFAEDLTPPGEWARARAERERTPSFPRGFGRPTKRQRRLLEGWLSAEDSGPGS